MDRHTQLTCLQVFAAERSAAMASALPRVLSYKIVQKSRLAYKIVRWHKSANGLPVLTRATPNNRSSRRCLQTPQERRGLHEISGRKSFREAISRGSQQVDGLMTAALRVPKLGKAD